jgi:hypothetical protein
MIERSLNNTEKPAAISPRSVFGIKERQILLADKKAGIRETVHRLRCGKGGHATCEQSQTHQTDKYATQKLGISHS